MIEYEGKEYATYKELAEAYGVNYQMARSRYLKGQKIDMPKRTPSQCGQLARRKTPWGMGSTLKTGVI